MSRLKVFSILFALCLTSTVHAQYTQLPSVPAVVFNVKDFGAVGDGLTLNTGAIQKALDAAKKQGGKVLIPEGIYLCGPLSMYSKTQLEISKGATLRLPNNPDEFPVASTHYKNFIDIAQASDVIISGSGTIDGQGDIWWKKTEENSLKYRRPQMVYIADSRRIEIRDIKFLNPPNTHLSIKNGSEVYIHGINIEAPANSHNTDGINISAQNCTIENCSIQTGDDNIAVNFGSKQQAPSNPECRNIIIRNCKFGCGHGLSIGSFTSGGLNNLQVSQCTFDGTTSAIRIKTARGRGGVVENVSYCDIGISNTRFPIFISGYYPKEPKKPQDDSTATAGPFSPRYRNITLKNIRVNRSENGVLIWGIPESPIQNIHFENLNISTKNGMKIYNAKGISFEKATINVSSGEKLSTYNAEVTGITDTD